MGIYKIPTVCLDLDDTLATNEWPAPPKEWMPGAKQALKDLHNEGVKLVVASTRLHPCDFYSWPVRKLRSEAAVAEDIHSVREFLDNSGFQYIEIYNEQGKCPADLYVDDKAVWYPGRKNSWNKLTPVILEKLGLDGGKYLS